MNIEKGELLVTGNLESIKQLCIENYTISIAYNKTHINYILTGDICDFTEKLYHHPVNVTGDQLRLLYSFNYRSNGLHVNASGTDNSRDGDYYEFAVYEFIKHEYILNPEKNLEVWYDYDSDRYYGRLNITKSKQGPPCSKI